jgi:TatD DNase family protein
MWTDTHLHLDDPAFDPDRNAVIARARYAGVEALICAGTSVDGSRRAIALAERFPAVWATVGIHPEEAASADGEALRALESLAGHPRVVAIGETGLDYVHERAPRAVQAEAFLAHVRLARSAGLPLVVHNREAHDDVERILREEGAAAVVMHCFSGTAEVAARWAAMGWMISFAGPLTFARAESLRAAARGVPDDRLLIETDAPYLAPVPMRGRRCEPAFVAHTGRALAAVKDMTVETLARALAENGKRVFFGPRFVVR